AQLGTRPPRRIFLLAVAYFASPSSATLENPQYVAGLRDLPSFQRGQARKDSLFFDLYIRRLGHCLQCLWCPIGAVTLAKVRIFVGEGTVVVKRCRPQHGAMSHHAGADPVYLFTMAA